MWVQIPLWVGGQSVQSDDIVPVPVAGPAYTQAVGSGSTVSWVFFAQEEIFPALLGQEQVVGCTVGAAVLQKN